MPARKSRSSRSIRAIAKETPSRRTSTQLVSSRTTSQKRIDANRRNARKSTGPRSAAGKKRVSQNALTHGLFSQTSPVLPFENKWEYEALAEAMVRDLRPLGILQREIVTQITQLCWKLRRIPAIETTILQAQMGFMEEEFAREKEDGEIPEDKAFPQATASVLIAAQFMMQGDRPFERLEMYQLRLQRSLHSAHRQLARLREETAGGEIADEDEAIYAAREFNRAVEENRAHQLREAAVNSAEDENQIRQNKPNDKDKSLAGREKEEEVAAIQCAGEDFDELSRIAPTPREEENWPRMTRMDENADVGIIREDS